MGENWKEIIRFYEEKTGFRCPLQGCEYTEEEIVRFLEFYNNHKEDKMEEKKKVVIIGSLKSEEEILKAAKFFEQIGFNVTHPFEDQSGTLIRIQRNYIRKIVDADLIVAVPKLRDNPPGGGNQSEMLFFGESTCYELALSYEFGKKVVYWSMEEIYHNCAFMKENGDGEVTGIQLI